MAHFSGCIGPLAGDPWSFTIAPDELWLDVQNPADMEKSKISFAVYDNVVGSGVLGLPVSIIRKNLHPFRIFVNRCSSRRPNVPSTVVAGGCWLSPFPTLSEFFNQKIVLCSMLIRESWTVFILDVLT